MLNPKQKELIDDYIKAIEERFPECKFVDICESPSTPNEIWINFTEPEDEDRGLELIEFVGNRTTDILLDYGYQILPMTI